MDPSRNQPLHPASQPVPQDVYFADKATTKRSPSGLTSPPPTRGSVILKRTCGIPASSFGVVVTSTAITSRSRFRKKISFPSCRQVGPFAPPFALVSLTAGPVGASGLLESKGRRYSCDVRTSTSFER